MITLREPTRNSLGEPDVSWLPLPQTSAVEIETLSERYCADEAEIAAASLHLLGEVAAAQPPSSIWLSNGGERIVPLDGLGEREFADVVVPRLRREETATYLPLRLDDDDRALIAQSSVRWFTMRTLSVVIEGVVIATFVDHVSRGDTKPVIWREQQPVRELDFPSLVNAVATERDADAIIDAGLSRLLAGRLEPFNPDAPLRDFGIELGW